MYQPWWYRNCCQKICWYCRALWLPGSDLPTIPVCFCLSHLFLLRSSVHPWKSQIWRQLVKCPHASMYTVLRANSPQLDLAREFCHSNCIKINSLMWFYFIYSYVKANFVGFPYKLSNPTVTMTLFETGSIILSGGKCIDTFFLLYCDIENVNCLGT